MTKAGPSIAQTLGRWANRTVLRPLGLCLVRPDVMHGPPGFVGIIPWAQRLFVYASLAKDLQDVDGDLVECGVYWGHGLLLLHVMNQLVLNRRRHIWGFDSFSGHPDPSEEDRSTAESAAVPGMGKFFRVDQEDVWQTLRLATGLPLHELRQDVTLVPGWFHETLPGFDRHVALLVFDGDLYRSAMAVFEHMWPRVSPGGIVICGSIDDVQSPGKGRAVREFFALKVRQDEAEFGFIDIGAALQHTYIRKRR